MVSTTEIVSNGSGSGLPPGQYRLIAFDMDTTGRRLIDEIIQIGAYYSPTVSYNEYAMPFRNLNIESRNRYLLRIITVGRYRMLKSDKTSKILKTKSEISVVTGFVKWLESLGTDSIILMTHETRKTVPLFLLEVLKKYNLYERFCNVVKGFANTYLFAEAKCAETVKSYSLYSLCAVLLDKEEELDSALDRAKLTYQIVDYLCSGDEISEDDKAAAMTEAIRKMANSIPDEETDLLGLKELIERQNSLRPIFGTMIRSRDRLERYRASTLRRLLAQAHLTYNDLQKAWEENQRDSLVKLINERVTKVDKPEELTDLTETLFAHFEPGYQPKLSSRPVKNAENPAPVAEKQPEEKLENITPEKPADVAAENDIKDADTSR